MPRLLSALGGKPPRLQSRLAGRCCHRLDPARFSRQLTSSQRNQGLALVMSSGSLPLLVPAAPGRGTQPWMLDLVACTKGPLLLQGRDPDGRVIVLERSEENPQLTWMWTHELRLSPNSTLCGDMPGTKDSTTPSQDKDRARPSDAQNRRKGGRC